MSDTPSTQIDSSRQIFGQALLGVLRGVARKPGELRYHVARDVWSITKRFGSAEIVNIEISDIPGIQDRTVEGYIDDANRVVVAALCAAVGAKSFFEIGTNRGRTAWTVARNVPDCRVVTLDLPSPDAAVALDLNSSDRAFLGEGWASGEAFHDTPEADRVTAVFGDSATFDFTPYAGAMDVVFIDGAHSYSYVRNDTEAARRMLVPNGMIAWDDYPTIPGVYRYLNEIAGTWNSPLYHVLGTRLVFTSGRNLVERLTEAERRKRGVA